MTKSELTDRQRQILDYIRVYTRDNGYPPSVRDIGDAIGLKSSSSVHSHLTALEKKGYISRSSSSARAITVNVEKLEQMYPDEAVNADSVLPEEEIDEVYRNVVPLPLVGRVAAGTPILAEQNIEETLGLPKQIVGDKNSFLLTVSGESMIDAGILDGDIVVVEEQNTARNGEIVVAMIDGEATVKTFYKEENRVRLQPQNPTMDPIYATDVTILGKVTALFRTIS
ncbi:MAG: transcriptional repressor LexA [Coriobacteriales bacterium]|jgi:repressor LexA